jgi:hypothetical protein
MNCEQFQDILQDLARNEWLDVPTLKDAFEHADNCGACDDLLQEAETLTGNLRSLAVLDSGRQASLDVEKSVLQAFARQKSSTLRQSNARLVTFASLTCVAALTLFALLLIHHKPVSSPQGSHPSSPAIPTVKANNGVQEASLSDVGNDLGNDPGALEQGASGTTQGDALSAFEDEDDAAGSFVPLTGTFDPAALDGGAVVRVVLSPTALQQFGLSSTQSGNKQVLADIVVGNDGTPQAIRVVGK